MPYLSQVHTVPVDDSEEHQLTASCKCIPGITVYASRRVHVTHASFDGREDAEELGVGESKGWSTLDHHGGIFSDLELKNVKDAE